nr:VOC family protein [Nocardiopsis sp. B62]
MTPRRPGARVPGVRPWHSCATSSWTAVTPPRWPGSGPRLWTGTPWRPTTRGSWPDSVRRACSTPRTTPWFWWRARREARPSSSRGSPEPRAAKNRVHVDLVGDGVELERLLSLGASVLARLPDLVVLADPEGNEFCLVDD